MKFKIWWKLKKTRLLNILSVIGAVASVAALLINYLPPPTQLPWWAFLLIAIAVTAMFGMFIVEFLSGGGQRVFRRSDTRGIRRYMHRWIEHGGRVAIWTRDMSWAQNEETRHLLVAKANRGELTLFMPVVTEFASELAAAGAVVHPYGDGRLESSSSRFTITSFGRGGAEVAVGHPDGDFHVIDEFSAGGHPAFYLAEDLVKLVTALQASNSET